MSWQIPVLGLAGAYFFPVKDGNGQKTNVGNKYIKPALKRILPVFGPAKQSDIDTIALLKAKALLKAREGFRRDVYIDSEGFLTVGIGHKVRPEDKLKFGEIATDQRINTWFEQDVKASFDAAKSQAIDLKNYDTDFIAALTSVNFQLGTNWKGKFPNTYNYLKKGQWKKAIANLLDAKWNEQTPVRVADFIAAINKTYG